MLPLQVRVSLGVMGIKSNSTFPVISDSQTEILPIGSLKLYPGDNNIIPILKHEIIESNKETYNLEIKLALPI